MRRKIINKDQNGEHVRALNINCEFGHGDNFRPTMSPGAHCSLPMG
jgi:hypothetical protein